MDQEQNSDHEEEEEESLDEDSEHSYNLRSRGSRSSATARFIQIPQNLVRIIQRLASNQDEEDGEDGGQAGDSDSSDDGIPFWPLRRESSLPKAPPRPSKEAVEALQSTDFYNETLLGLGPDIEDCQRFRVSHNLLNLLQRRENGDVLFHRFGNFSQGTKRQILSEFLPKRPQTVAKLKAKVFCGTYSKKGDFFMSACQDSKIRLYHTTDNSFRFKRSITARDVGWSVLDVALSPDGYNIIYSSWTNNIHQVSLFDEDDSKHIALPVTDDQYRFCIFSLRFSSDGLEILAGANNGQLYLYDRCHHRSSLKIDAHEDDVNAVSFVDEATHILASGGDDGLVKVWDRRALREDNPVPVGVFAGHTDGITFLDPRDDARHIISNSKDQTIKLWDLRKFSNNRSIEATRKAVRCQTWDYRWARPPPGARRGKAMEEDQSSLMTYRGHQIVHTLIRCRFSPAHTTGQRYIYTGCASGSVVIYDALTGEIVKTLEGHNGCVRDVSWHPYLNEIVSSSWDQSVIRWKYVDESIEDEIEENNVKEDRNDDKDKYLLKIKRSLRNRLV